MLSSITDWHPSNLMPALAYSMLYDQILAMEIGTSKINAKDKILDYASQIGPMDNDVIH